MTNEQINIAIANSLGWTEIRIEPEIKLTITGIIPGADQNDEGSRYYITDYCNDLNSLHAVKKTLISTEHGEYLWDLAMKTIGKWEDAK
jgi:hypothetical protein